MATPKSLNIRNLIFAVILLSTFTVTSATAQRFEWPESPENLQVLPDTLGGQQLGRIMRGFTRALGVRCEHCHVGEPGQSLVEFDFASDNKPAKETARVMLQMVRMINTDYIATLSTGASHELLSVTCTTCHRGRARPEMLQDVISKTAIESGVDSAIVRYRDLREDYYGGFSFDFQEGTLTRVAGTLEGVGDLQGAVELMELEIEVSGESPQSLAALADLQAKAGMKDEAIKSLEKAIELAPARMKQFLGRQLDQIKQ